MTVIAQSEVKELVKVGRDGDEHILVERELLLNVGEQRVDLVRRVCVVVVVYGRGGDGGHRVI